jgi:hypothetical protein
MDTFSSKYFTSSEAFPIFMAFTISSTGSAGRKEVKKKKAARSNFIITTKLNNFWILAYEDYPSPD